MPTINPNQFGGVLKAAGQVARPAAVGGVLGGPIGMAAGAGYGVLQTPAAHTAESNIGNVAGGAMRGAESGFKSGMKSYGPIGGMIDGEAGAIRGAMNTPAARNIVNGAESGAKRGFGIANSIGLGPIGGLIGGGIGAIGGLFHNRNTSATKPTAPASNSYTVKSGDTLSGIAAAHNMTLANLYKDNPEFKNNPKYQGGNMIWSGGKVNLSNTSPALLNNAQMKNATPPASIKAPTSSMATGSIGSTPAATGSIGSTPATPPPPKVGQGGTSKVQNLPFTTSTETPQIQPMHYKGNRPPSANIL